jgi:hypothetical protein
LRAIVRAWAPYSAELRTGGRSRGSLSMLRRGASLRPITRGAGTTKNGFVEPNDVTVRQEVQPQSQESSLGVRSVHSISPMLQLTGVPTSAARRAVTHDVSARGSVPASLWRAGSNASHPVHQTTSTAKKERRMRDRTKDIVLKSTPNSREPHLPDRFSPPSRSCTRS